MRSYQEPLLPRHVWGLIIAILVVLLALCVSPALGDDFFKGGGFSEEGPSAVCIVKVSETPLQAGSASYIGTGTFISDRLILTCYHNIRDLDQNPGKHNLKVYTKRGHETTKVKVVHKNKEQDLCLLLTDDSMLVVPMIVSSGVNSTGDIQTIGFDPKEKQVRVYSGTFDSKESQLTVRKGYGPVWFQYKSRTVQGMSGGPVVDVSTNELVGVIVSSSVEHNGLSQAVNLKRIQQFLDDYDGETGKLSL